MFMQTYFNPDVHLGSYALIGACAILSGYARHTFSLSVIMMECTEQINMFIPVTWAILIAFYVAGIYNKSIYVIGVRTKNIPFLVEEVPHSVHKVTAKLMMTCPPRSLTPVTTLADIARVLSDKPMIHGFPIVEDQDYVVGLISRESLMILVSFKVWVERDENSNFKNESEAVQKRLMIPGSRFSVQKGELKEA